MIDTEIDEKTVLNATTKTEAIANAEHRLNYEIPALRKKIEARIQKWNGITPIEIGLTGHERLAIETVQYEYENAGWTVEVTEGNEKVILS